MAIYEQSFFLHEQLRLELEVLKLQKLGIQFSYVVQSDVSFDLFAKLSDLRVINGVHSLLDFFDSKEVAILLHKLGRYWNQLNNLFIAFVGHIEYYIKTIKIYICYALFSIRRFGSFVLALAAVVKTVFLLVIDYFAQYAIRFAILDISETQ